MDDTKLISNPVYDIYSDYKSKEDMVLHFHLSSISKLSLYIMIFQERRELSVAIEDEREPGLLHSKSDSDGDGTHL